MRTESRLILGTAGFDLGVSRKKHLELLDSAWELGINHFDTAPIYAHGQSESILGEFLKRHPDAKINTKVGLSGRVFPAIPAPIFRLAKLGSRLARALRPKRSGSKVNQQKGSQRHGTLDVENLKKSLEGSLGRLGVSSVSTLLLHEAHPESANDAKVMDFMNDLMKQGIIGQAGLAGSNLGEKHHVLNPIYNILQSEFYLGSYTWPAQLLQPSGTPILYGGLRPMRPLSARLLELGLTNDWKRKLNSGLDGDDGLAVWLIAWALWKLPNSRAVLFSSKASHIRQISRGIPKLLKDPERLALFENLYKQLP
jgi:hypothetical protein